MNRENLDILSVGICTDDHIAVIPRMPSFEGHTKMIQSSQQGGGPAATAAVAASKLGAQTGFVGRVGDDRSGEFIAADFERYGVSTEYLQLQKGRKSRKVFVLVEESSGERAFIDSESSLQPPEPEDLPLEAIAAAKILFIDSYAGETVLAAAKRASNSGTEVILDCEGNPDLLPRLLPYVDVFIPSGAFFKKWQGEDKIMEKAQNLRERGPEQIVVTLGERGCICVGAKESFSLPAFPVSVVDTTGCGDVFHGGYAFARLQGWSLRRSAYFASAVAALKARKIGGREGIPDLEETLEFLEERASGWKD